MATPANRVVETFISPFPHPAAFGVDALTHTWDLPGTMWIYPPTPLIRKVLNKIQQQTNLRIILVAPEQESREWYPDLCRYDSISHEVNSQIDLKSN